MIQSSLFPELVSQPKPATKQASIFHKIEPIQHEDIEHLNELIIAQHDMKLYERRIFIKIIEHLPEPTVINGITHFEPLILNAAEIILDSELKGSSAITELAKATEKLLKHICKIEDDKKLLQVGLISSATYKKGYGQIVIRFDQAIYPYLLHVKNQFKKEQLTGLMNFRSFYAQCFYELFKRESATKDKLYIPISNLRQLLGIENVYERYNDLKKRVIYQAQEELDAQGEIEFTFVEKKYGRKVIGLIFYFTVKK